MRRGEIWWASLPDSTGSGPGYRRPVVVIQSDSFNESRISTVIVASITSNLRLSAAPGNIFLERHISMLPSDSVVNVSQILTVESFFLTELVQELPREIMNSIDDGLRLVLHL